MADTKISSLTDGATAVATDEFPAARSGANVKLTPAQILAYGGSPITGTTLKAINLTASSLVFSDSNKVLTSSGSVTVLQGGTGATTAADARTNLGVTATGADTTYAFRANNLSDLPSAATARTNLGISATGADTTYAFRANNLSDLGSAVTARTNLGLGSIATQAASGVSITGGTVSGITDITVADGGTGASTAADARSNLGLGTMSTQSAGAVAITGGAVTGITDITVADGGTGASTATNARINLLPSYTSNAGKVLAVNSSVTDLEWVTLVGGGTVSSVDMSGGATGLTYSGGPVTSSGTITTAGTLAVANGGTGTATPNIVAGTNVTVSGTWPNQTVNSTASGTGDVVGPSSATDNAITRFDLTTGKLVQNSLVTVADDGAIVAPQVGSVIPFYFANQAAFPSASTYHGALAHSHADAAMYFAHGGAWIKMLDDTTDVTVAQGGTGLSTLTANNVILGNGTATPLFVAPSTTGNVLTSNGTTWTSAAAAGGPSITNDTTTASNYFPLFATATSGTPTVLNTSNAKLLYKPSTGELQAEELVALNGLIVNKTTVAANYTIASGYNAMSVGPITINSGISVTISSGQRWLVL